MNVFLHGLLTTTTITKNVTLFMHTLNGVDKATSVDILFLFDIIYSLEGLGDINLVNLLT